MRFRFMLLFLAASVGALFVGIGIAELQLSLVQSEDETSPVSANSGGVDNLKEATRTAKVAEKMVSILLEDRKSRVEQLRADCRFRHPGDHRVIESCVEDDLAAAEQVARIFDSEASDLGKGVIIYCMDENPSLNGVDWKAVGWCYERNIIALRKAAERGAFAETR